MQNKLEQLVLGLRGGKITIDEGGEQFRREYIVQTLIACRFNQCKAARELKMHRNTLRLQMLKYRIDIAALKGKPIRSEHTRELVERHNKRRA